MSDQASNPALDAAKAHHGYGIGLAGWSGSGKTTLAEKLIAALTARGLDVATIKHAHHAFTPTSRERTATATARQARNRSSCLRRHGL